MNRRTLLNALVAGLAIPLAPIRLAHAAQRSGRRLILVELSGANDGLNTVVPIKDERYREIRPNIGLKGQEVFDIGNIAHGAGVTLLKTAAPTKRAAHGAQNMGVLGAVFLLGHIVRWQDFWAAVFLSNI